MSTSTNLLYAELMERVSPTGAWVVWAPLVAGGGPRRAGHMGSCGPPLVCEADSLAAVADGPLQLRCVKLIKWPCE